MSWRSGTNIQIKLIYSTFMRILYGLYQLYCTSGACWLENGSFVKKCSLNPTFQAQTTFYKYSFYKFSKESLEAHITSWEWRSFLIINHSQTLEEVTQSFFIDKSCSNRGNVLLQVASPTLQHQPSSKLWRSLQDQQQVWKCHRFD